MKVAFSIGDTELSLYEVSDDCAPELCIELSPEGWRRYSAIMRDYDSLQDLLAAMYKEKFGRYP
jgi:hypothetical protein